MRSGGVRTGVLVVIDGIVGLRLVVSFPLLGNRSAAGTICGGAVHAAVTVGDDPYAVADGFALLWLWGIIDDDDFLGQAVFVKFVPVRLL